MGVAARAPTLLDYAGLEAKGMEGVIPRLADLFLWLRDVHTGPATTERRRMQKVRADLERSRKAVSKALSVLAGAEHAMQAEAPLELWVPEWTRPKRPNQVFAKWRLVLEVMNREIVARRAVLTPARGPVATRRVLAGCFRQILEDAGVKIPKSEQGAWASCLRVGLREALGIHVQSVLGTLKAAKTSPSVSQ